MSHGKPRVDSPIVRSVAVITLLISVLLSSCSSRTQEGGATGSDNSTSVGSESASPDSDLSELIAAAQEEGSLFWYSVPREGIAQEISDAFSEKYGIHVDFVRGGSSTIQERYGGEAQADAIVADVTLMSNGPWNEAALAQDWFIDLPNAGIPGLTDEFPSEFIRPTSGAFVAGIDPFAIAYNTELVSEDQVPTDWTDLLDNKWAGEILLIDPTPFSYTWNWAAIEGHYGEEYITTLGTQVQPRLYPLLAPLLEALSAGEGAIGIPPSATSVADAKAAGNPVDFIVPDFAWATEYVVNVSKDAPNPNAARLFARFLLIEEGQEVLANTDGLFSPHNSDAIPGELVYGPPETEPDGNYVDKFGVFVEES